MRVYVAGKFEEKVRVREVMDQLVKAGHTITYDWTTNEQVSAEQAAADVDGVCGADALVIVAEKNLPYCGTLVELGLALACYIPVFVLGHALDERCIFLQLPEINRGIDILLE